MEITKLPAPRPWPKPRLQRNWDFQATGMLRPPKVLQRKLGKLEDILESRQSRREFKSALTLQQLGDLCWHSNRVRVKDNSGDMTAWESRPAPSGGGCHPIHVIIFPTAFLPNALLEYVPDQHVFGVRHLPSTKLALRSISEVERCLRIGRGTVLWFVADLGHSGRRYRYPESLAWRDSGALLATIGLVSEAMGINCCGLGLHEIPCLTQFLKLNDSAIGVGGCIVSGR